MDPVLLFGPGPTSSGGHRRGRSTASTSLAASSMAAIAGARPRTGKLFSAGGVRCFLKPRDDRDLRADVVLLQPAAEFLAITCPQSFHDPAVLGR